MRTLGIDLSADAAKTATCILEWHRESSGTGLAVELRLDDARLLAMMGEADRVGIDAPFGWPDQFLATVSAWSESGTWPSGVAREALRYRETDRFQTAQVRRPLSVSSDRIASTAMRCADLLQRNTASRGERLDRVEGHAIEVYPAGALVAWGIDVKGYKQATAVDARRSILDQLVDRARLTVSLEAAVPSGAAARLAPMPSARDPSSD